MIPSKIIYMMVGFDLTCALACSLAHDMRCFIFLGLAFFINYVGDLRRTKEEK